MKLPLSYKEPHTSAALAQGNWLRAAVLGANDGIVSIAALVVGVAGATTDSYPILIAGVAGLLAGALSMAVGEYVSVSSQRDIDVTLLNKERYELKHSPQEELEELTTIYQHKGLQRHTAEIVAKELMARDAFAAHAESELHIDPHALVNPWVAAVASGLSFTVGAIIPLVTILLHLPVDRIVVTFAAVLVALIITGVLSARASGAPVGNATTRVVVGGILAMVITFGIGRLFGVASL